MKSKTSSLIGKIAALAAVVVVAVHSVHAETYYWIGGDDANWADKSSWSFSEGGPALGEDDALPSSSDDVIVNSAVKINITNSGGNAQVTSMTLGANVTLATDKTPSCSGNRQDSRYLIAQSITGEYTLTLQNVGLRSVSGVSQLTVDSNVCVPEGYTSVFMCDGMHINLNGNLSGGGNVHGFSNGQGWGVKFYSVDNSGFSGVFKSWVSTGANRDATQFYTAGAASANAVWDIKSHDTVYLIPASNLDSIKFGALKGRFIMYTASYSGNVIEIGGRNEDCSFGGQFGRGYKDSGHIYYQTFRKVGTGKVTFTGSDLSLVEIQSGILELTASIPYNTATYYITFTGPTGVLQLGTAEKSLDPSALLKNSHYPITYDDQGRSETWATAIAASNDGGFTKKGSGTLTLAAVPAYTGTTTIEAGTLVVPQGTTITELSCAGGKLTIPFTGTEDETAVLTIAALAEGTTVEDVEEAVSVVGATMSVEAGEGGYIVKATRTPQTFAWTGSVDEDWTTPGNWKIGAEVAASAPLAIDTVRFPLEGAPWTVSLPSQQTVTNVTVDGATTFSGALIQTGEVYGEGVITLGDDAGFSTYSSSDARLVISNDLVIAASVSTTNTIKSISSGNASGADVWLYGNLTGSGTVMFTGPRLSCELAGDNSDFEGTIYVKDDGSKRNATHLASAAASSAKAKWDICNSETRNFAPATGTRYFGELSGEYRRCVAANWKGVATDVIGALNTSFTLSGQFGTAYDRSDKIVKVGTGTMTFSGKNVNSYEMQGGVIEFTSDQTKPYLGYTFTGGGMRFTEEVAIDPSTNITDSTSAIVFDDGGVDREWEYPLAASNVGGLTKRGSGTLELTAVPLYTGLTTVEEGMLVVPQGTELEVNALSGANRIVGATVTKYAYPVGTTLTAPETSGSAVYDASIDVSNLVAVDASGVTLVPGEPYIIAAAPSVVGFRNRVTPIALTLPDGADPARWSLRVRTVNGRRCLCIAEPIGLAFTLQ